MLKVGVTVAVRVGGAVKVTVGDSVTVSVGCGVIVGCGVAVCVIIGRLVLVISGVESPVTVGGVYFIGRVAEGMTHPNSKMAINARINPQSRSDLIFLDDKQYLSIF